MEFVSQTMFIKTTLTWSKTHVRSDTTMELKKLFSVFDVFYTVCKLDDSLLDSGLTLLQSFVVPEEGGIVEDLIFVDGFLAHGCGPGCGPGAVFETVEETCCWWVC